MKRKGISPLIAAVLLIAFTMAVASLFAQWAPQLIKQAQGDTLNESDQIQKCSQLRVEVAQADLDNGDITIQQTQGDSPIGNMSVTWYHSDGSIDQTYAVIDSQRGTDQTSVTTSGIDEVQIDPIECKGASTTTYP